MDGAGKRLSAGTLNGDGGVCTGVLSVVMDGTLGSFVVAGDTLGSGAAVGDTLGSGAGEAMGFGSNIEARC